MSQKTLKIHPADNVAVALSSLAREEEISIDNDTVHLVSPVPQKHKFALKDLDKDDDIIMYGVLVGKANESISRGQLLTVKNIHHATSNFTVRERHNEWSPPDVSKWKNKTFNGYHRADGAVGVANYWVVIPLVFCENKNVDVLRDAFLKELGYEHEASPYRGSVQHLLELYRSGASPAEIENAVIDSNLTAVNKTPRIFPNVDGIKFLNHTMGCGGTRDDARALCGLLAGYITHPNVAGATVLSLGCQNAQAEILRKEILSRDPSFSKPLFVIDQQQEGLESDVLKKAVKQTFLGLMKANEIERRPAPLSKLCLGLECGGSDGFSGISANPAIGFTSDLLVTLGGSVILSEFPELCGVEQELSDRCVDEDMARKLENLMRTYNQRAEALGSGFFANPSPGNIKDGLITDAIKSAGAAKKGGTSPVAAVLDYPEKATRPGLNLLCTPGSDIESTTAEVGSGATIVLFTTGLGTPTGNPISPVVKISTNTALYEKMQDIIDIDTGGIITGKETIQQAGERILDYIIELANGNIKAKAEASGHDDFIPWKRGISL